MKESAQRDAASTNNLKTSKKMTAWFLSTDSGSHAGSNRKIDPEMMVRCETPVVARSMFSTRRSSVYEPAKLIKWLTTKLVSFVHVSLMDKIRFVHHYGSLITILASEICQGPIRGSTSNCCLNYLMKGTVYVTRNGQQCLTVPHASLGQHLGFSMGATHAMNPCHGKQSWIR